MTPAVACSSTRRRRSSTTHSSTRRQYRKQLEASCPSDPELLRAWLEGDWAVARGAYFACGARRESQRGADVGRDSDAPRRTVG